MFQGRYEREVADFHHFELCYVEVGATTISFRLPIGIVCVKSGTYGGLVVDRWQYRFGYMQRSSVAVSREETMDGYILRYSGSVDVYALIGCVATGRSGWALIERINENIEIELFIGHAIYRGSIYTKV